MNTNTIMPGSTIVFVLQNGRTELPMNLGKGIYNQKYKP